LEWPMVICHSLEGKLRSDVFGMHIVSDSAGIDLENILAGRWLRFWINPYSDQSGGTALAERLEVSEVSKVAREQALQEEARLMYVGITRARDYLVFPTRKKATLWLNRVWHDGDEKVPALDESSGETQWEWGDVLYKETWVQAFPKEFTHTDPKEEQILFLDERQGNRTHKSYQIDLTKEQINDFTGKLGAITNYGAAFQITEDTDTYTLLKMTKAFLMADHLEYDQQLRGDMASGFLERFELTETITENALLDYSQKFFEYLGENFSIKKIHRKYPIRHFYQKRLFETEIDFVIETDQGIVIIQNSDFAGKAKQYKNEALKMTPWLHLCKTALQVIFQKGKVRTMVHFVLDGTLVGVETKVKAGAGQLSL
jgi:ATP-dependent helicase/nuclease subunit A